jgi:hypothetical protein
VREHVRVFEEGQRVVSLGELSAMEIMEAGGLAAFWSGLVPGLQHHFLSGGVKIGLYDPVKTAICTALPTGTSMLIVSALAGTPARLENRLFQGKTQSLATILARIMGGC